MDGASAAATVSASTTSAGIAATAAVLLLYRPLPLLPMLLLLLRPSMLLLLLLPTDSAAQTCRCSRLLSPLPSTSLLQPLVLSKPLKSPLQKLRPLLTSRCSLPPRWPPHPSLLPWSSLARLPFPLLRLPALHRTPPLLLQPLLLVDEVLAALHPLQL